MKTNIIGTKAPYWLQLVLILFVTGVVPSLASGADIKAEQGTIDLANWNPKDGPLQLSGAWVFLWNEFTAPIDVTKRHAEAQTFSNLPGKWIRLSGPASKTVAVNDFGYGTYILKITGLNIANKELALNFKQLAVSYRAYLVSPGNSKVVSLIENGSPGVDAATTVPFLLYRTANMPDLDETTQYLVIHVANFHLNTQNFNDAPHIGELSVLTSQNNRMHHINFFLFGIMFAICIYLFGHYLQKDKDISSLWLGVFCIGMLGYNIVAGFYLEYFMPYPSLLLFNIHLKSEYIFAVAGVGAYLLFLISSYAKYVKASAKYVLCALGLMLFPAIIILPPATFTSHLLIVHATTLIVASHLFLGMLRAIRARENEAMYTMLILTPIVVTFLHDILVAIGAIFTPSLIKYTMVLFLLLQSRVLGLRFAKALSRAKFLSTSLQDEVSKQTTELTNANAHLQHLDKEKTRFFQNISHELRTPLTLIMSPLEQIRKTQPDEKNIQIALKNSHRLYRLVNQLLDWQKIAAGRYKVNLTPIQLIPFLRTSSEYFENSCALKHIEFVSDLPENEPLCVAAQIDILEKILFNYLSNALKFCDEYGRIELTAKIEDNNVRISVKDTGPGISMDEQQKLFKVFSQLDNSTTRKNEGSGIGLALVKELADKLRGSVGVISEPGAGSTFWVKLPLYHMDREVIDILYLDDDLIQRDTFLNDMDEFSQITSFRAFASIAEGRVLAETHQIKILMTDDVLPGEDVVALLEDIARLQPFCKRILVTAEHEGHEIVLQAISKGLVDQLVYKPWQPDTLFAGLAADIQASPIGDLRTDASFEVKEWMISENINQTTTDLSAKTTAATGEIILVVDDLADMRDLIADRLQAKNYRILTAANGKAALAVVDQNRPDLIITDWMMPEMSGPDLINQLKNDTRYMDIPVVLLTAKSDEESKILGVGIGADAFLGKPFNEAELESTIKNLLTLKQKEKEIARMNKYLTEKVLQRFLPPSMVASIANGEMTLDDSVQKRLVTILFTDLCNFTKVTQQIGADKISGILNDYFTQMTDVVFEFNGMVDKFIGDALMVIFGVPTTSSPVEQARSAALCAWNMQLMMREFNNKWVKKGYPELNMRIGIHQGEAIVGSFGSNRRSDYTAIGSTVNLASRIENSAKMGEIYVSETIIQHLDTKDYSMVGKFNLKGIDQSVTLYKLEEYLQHSQNAA